MEIQRYNIFYLIHKSLRAMLYELPYYFKKRILTAKPQLSHCKKHTLLCRLWRTMSNMNSLRFCLLLESMMNRLHSLLKPIMWQ
jgi:hypothetical protein